MKVVISPSLIDMIKNEIRKDMKIETGGVLAGFIDEARKLVITHISGPGPKAKKKRDGFLKDIEFCQKFLDEVYQSTQTKSNYMGEWHYHPSLSHQPSKIDINSISDISTQPEYLLDEALMIIVTKDFNIHYTVHPSNKEYYKTDGEIRN